MLLAMSTTSLLQAVVSTASLLLQATVGSDAMMKLLIVDDIAVATSSGERFSRQRRGESSRFVDGVTTVAREGTLVRIYALVMLLLDLGERVVRCRPIEWWW
ncbi:Hypothetical predicted protein [Olea europaea subsp. europaea]|uniref:Secreted protein n=1 Tax=Olea europaea subsp. europaea TaxID=158383 RepID=A0A8S0RA43_OLEEU|nr:Hypothetical predicted protein [Olea europaea subsp. europaea]